MFGGDEGDEEDKVVRENEDAEKRFKQQTWKLADTTWGLTNKKRGKIELLKKEGKSNKFMLTSEKHKRDAVDYDEDSMQVPQQGVDRQAEDRDEDEEPKDFTRESVSTSTNTDDITNQKNALDNVIYGLENNLKKMLGGDDPNLAREEAEKRFNNQVWKLADTTWGLTKRAKIIHNKRQATENRDAKHMKNLKSKLFRRKHKRAKQNHGRRRRKVNKQKTKSRKIKGRRGEKSHKQKPRKNIRNQKKFKEIGLIYLKRNSSLKRTNQKNLNPRQLFTKRNRTFDHGDDGHYEDHHGDNDGHHGDEEFHHGGNHSDEEFHHGHHAEHEDQGPKINFEKLVSTPDEHHHAEDHHPMMEHDEHTIHGEEGRGGDHGHGLHQHHHRRHHDEEEEPQEEDDYDGDDDGPGHGSFHDDDHQEFEPEEHHRDHGGEDEEEGGRHETANAAEVDHMLPKGYEREEHHRMDNRIFHEEDEMKHLFNDVTSHTHDRKDEEKAEDHFVDRIKKLTETPWGLKKKFVAGKDNDGKTVTYKISCISSVLMMQSFLRM